MNRENIITDNQIKAVVFDIDTILDTERLHHTVWKQVLNEFLNNNYPEKAPLSEEEYDRFIAGKPKIERIKNLLDSREVSLSFGSHEDPPGEKSICALENQKSRLFNQLLVAASTNYHKQIYNRIIEWKEAGIMTAVVSSDEHFSKIPDTEDLQNLFDVKVDGSAAKKMGLKDKPEADVFMEAVKQMGLSPAECALFDSTVCGLQAASKASFGLVAGIPKQNNAKELSENGADVIVHDFDELDLLNDPEIKMRFENPIPPFASEYTKIGELLHDKTPVIFLDYDGTLTPIVNRPEDAILSDEMKEVLKACASRLHVAIVSGRDMIDLKNRVDIDEIIYAGSHGFRISGPEELYLEHEKSASLLPRLDETEKQLQQIFSGKFKGVQVERKRYAIAVHYRNARKEEIPDIKQTVTELVEKTSGLKTGEGKMILEIKPDIDWHKGKAVHWILEKLNLTDRDKYLPIYIGDDITDEDAYESLSEWGISIQVGPGIVPSASKFRLKNIYQVRIFLKEFTNVLI
jgi:trehalose 6-phosphate phosphatase